MVNGEATAHYYESRYMSPNLQKINITCDQITFNPLEETITILACDFKDNIHDEETNDKVKHHTVGDTTESFSNNYTKELNKFGLIVSLIQNFNKTKNPNKLK